MMTIHLLHAKVTLKAERGMEAANSWTCNNLHMDDYVLAGDYDNETLQEMIELRDLFELGVIDETEFSNRIAQLMDW